MAALLQGEVRWQTSPRRGTETIARTLTVEEDAEQLFRQAARDRAATIRALAADALIRQGPDAFPEDDWQPLTRGQTTGRASPYGLLSSQMGDRRLAGLSLSAQIRGRLIRRAVAETKKARQLNADGPFQIPCLTD